MWCLKTPGRIHLGKPDRKLNIDIATTAEMSEPQAPIQKLEYK